MDGGHASEISYSSSVVFKVKLVGTNNQKQFKEVFAMPKGRNAKKRKTRSNRLSSFFLLSYDTEIFHIN